MKRLLILSLCLIPLFASAQQREDVYAVGFYNLENLFDARRDTTILDGEFTPDGPRRWTEVKYRKKLDNMATVIGLLGREHCPAGAAIVGVTEVENRGVLEDLVKADPLADTGYEFVHYDSPDRRGIDVAMLYNPALFSLASSCVYPFVNPDDEDYRSRDVLLASGEMGGERVHVLVNHWPSRFGGRKSSKLRETAAAVNRRIADSLYAADPSARIVIMGDMNDDPTDRSCRVVLDAKRRPKDVVPGGLYNTVWQHHRRGAGTIAYKGQWNLFDQIIVSQNTLEPAGLRFLESEIFNRGFMIRQEGRYRGYPLRTFSEGRFLNGFSDHFPVLIYLKADR